jgi:hypothetical protein
MKRIGMVTYEQIAEAMTFFGDENDDVFLAFPDEQNIGLGGKYILKFFDDRFRIDISAELGSHKELVGFFLHELAIAFNIEIAPEKDFVMWNINPFWSAQAIRRMYWFICYRLVPANVTS